MESSDIIVIGGGIAGVSAAAELAAGARVTLLEMESQPGYHATGRSAAFFAAAYGHRIVREITASCESFLLNPPDGFTDVELLRPRDCMFFAREDQQESLHAMLEEYDSLAFIDAAAVRERVPVFAEGYLYGAAHERRGGDLDVDALLQGYLRLFRRLGGELKNDHRVDGLRFENGTWRVTAGAAEFRAPVVVNAAGGWVEQVAELAGLGSLGIRPMRRTALTVDAPDGISISDWPEMVDVDEEFYFKPEAGLIMISPADETPTRPCDAQPEDLDVATGVYRFEQATGLDVRQVRSSWAGLRTFAPDRLFVTGFDPRAEGFFWLAGQGGYGIQSAAAMAQMTRYLVQDIEPDEAFAAVSRYVEELSPARLLYA